MDCIQQSELNVSKGALLFDPISANVLDEFSHVQIERDVLFREQIDFFDNMRNRYLQHFIRNILKQTPNPSYQ